MRGASSKRGAWTTTRCARTAAWGIELRQSSRRKSAGKRAVEKPLRGKVQTTFPLRLEIPQTRRDSHFPTAPATTVYFPASPRGLKTKPGVLHYDWTKNRGQVRRFFIVLMILILVGVLVWLFYLTCVLQPPSPSPPGH